MQHCISCTDTTYILSFDLVLYISKCTRNREYDEIEFNLNFDIIIIFFPTSVKWVSAYNVINAISRFVIYI